MRQKVTPHSCLTTTSRLALIFVSKTHPTYTHLISCRPPTTRITAATTSATEHTPNTSHSHLRR